MWLPIYMIHLDLTFNISHPAAKKSIFLFVCLFFKTLFIYLHGFPHKHRNKRTRPFATSHLCRRKPSRWRVKVALGQDKQRKLPFEINHVFLLFVQPRHQGAFPWLTHLQSQEKAPWGRGCCLTCPSATFACQHGGFVPREWLAAKGLFANS